MSWLGEDRHETPLKSLWSNIWASYPDSTEEYRWQSSQPMFTIMYLREHSKLIGETLANNGAQISYRSCSQQRGLLTGPVNIFNPHLKVEKKLIPYHDQKADHILHEA